MCLVCFGWFDKLFVCLVISTLEKKNDVLKKKTVRGLQCVNWNKESNK